MTVGQVGPRATRCHQARASDDETWHVEGRGGIKCHVVRLRGTSSQPTLPSKN
ncbi:hypothetical protein D9X30_1635 (plasmid) [Cupriavidus sp. U2]|nr:hypothetical protein D9X30_1635 [Cupriavidus sp. U2]